MKLNKDLSFQEVSVAVNKAKDGKAYMEIPSEALKRPLAMKLLHNFLTCVSNMVCLPLTGTLAT